MEIWASSGGETTCKARKAKPTSTYHLSFCLSPLHTREKLKLEDIPIPTGYVELWSLYKKICSNVSLHTNNKSSSMNWRSYILLLKIKDFFLYSCTLFCLRKYQTKQIENVDIVSYKSWIMYHAFWFYM